MLLVGNKLAYFIFADERMLFPLIFWAIFVVWANKSFLLTIIRKGYAYDYLLFRTATVLNDLKCLKFYGCI